MMLVSLASLVPAQPQNRVYREGGGWAEEITGSLPAAKNLRVKVDAGSVRIVGGSQQSINYVVRNHAYSSSEDKARREFDSYKISAYVRGDTAWVVGEWQGGRPPSKCSAEFVINAPRQMELVKVETEGGSVSTTGIVGRAGTSNAPRSSPPHCRRPNTTTPTRAAIGVAPKHTATSAAPAPPTPRWGAPARSPRR